MFCCDGVEMGEEKCLCHIMQGGQACSYCLEREPWIVRDKTHEAITEKALKAALSQEAK
jgi:hypothetical protein